MILFLLFVISVLSYVSHTPIEWSECNNNEADLLQLSQFSIPGTVSQYDVNIQDIEINKKHIPVGGSLTAMIRGKLLSGNHLRPHAYVQIRRKQDNAFIANINFGDICSYIQQGDGKTRCPIKESDYVEFELKHPIPGIINIFLDGEQTEFTVISVITSQEMENVGCVKFDIMITQ